MKHGMMQLPDARWFTAVVSYGSTDHCAAALQPIICFITLSKNSSPPKTARRSRDQRPPLSAAATTTTNIIIVVILNFI